MVLTLRGIELDGLLFQVKKPSFLYLAYFVFCVYLKCGEWTVANLNYEYYQSMSQHKAQLGAM
jgi:hypothetical protein